MIQTRQKTRKQISNLSLNIEIINPIESKTLFGGCNYCNNGYSQATGWACQNQYNYSSTWDSGPMSPANFSGFGSGPTDNSWGSSYDSNQNFSDSNGDGINDADQSNYNTWVDSNGDGINDAEQLQETEEWGFNQFFEHYNNANGQTVNLNDIGLRDEVILSDVYLEMLRNVNIQIEDLVHTQVANGNNQPGTYQFTWDFNNSYDFTLIEGLFAIGSATFTGQFTGNYTLDYNCNIDVTGTLNLNFHDSFEDPWDIINTFQGSWDPTGTPYSINDNWEQGIFMSNIVP